MYVPVTGPNGEQGFAPVQMQMPQPMPYTHPPAPNGSATGPVQFVQGPNGFFMPVSAAPPTQPASAAYPAQPVTAAAMSRSVATGGPREVELAGPSVMSSNPFEPQAAVQRRQWPQQIPGIGDAAGPPAAAAGDGATGAQSSPQKPPAARPSLESSPGRPSNVSSAASLSRPDSSNSLSTAEEDGGFRTASDGSLTGPQRADVFG
jgi:hypothetical protein